MTGKDTVVDAQSELEYLLITPDELETAVIGMAEDDDDRGALAFNQKILARKVTLSNLIEMIDRRIALAKTPDHLDDLNLIVDELEDIIKGKSIPKREGS